MNEPRTVTQEQAEKLLHAMATWQQVDGEHPAVYDLLALVQDTLEQAQRHHVEQHLEFCLPCAEQFHALEQAWTRSNESAPLHPADETPILLAQHIGLAESMAALTSTIREGARDGLDWQTVEQADGTLEFDVSSSNTNLLGKRLRLRAGAWQTEIELRQVDDNAVGADYTMSAEVRKTLAPDTDLYGEWVEG